MPKTNVRAILALIAASILLTVAPVQAGSEESPEISDASGDVNPLAFLTSNPAPEDAALPAQQDALDLTKVYITGEGPTWFYVRMHVKDFPNAWELPPIIADELYGQEIGPQIQYLSLNLSANFTIAGQAYRAVAWLSSPSPDVQLPDVPEVPALVDSYWLVGPAGQRQAIPGEINLQGNYVQMRVHKSLVGNPADGSKLSQFWAHSDFAGKFKVDFAPNARAFDPLTDHRPAIPMGDPLGTQLVISQFGLEYAFGAYHPPSVGLEVAAIGSMSHQYAPGDSYTYEFRVKNTGAVQDAGLLVVSPAAPGWIRELSDTAFDLASGASKTFRLTVLPAQGADREDVADVTVDSNRGAHQVLRFTSALSDFLPGGGPGGDPINTDPLRTDGAPQSKKKSPGVEAVLIVGSVLAMAALMRRRRD